MAVAHRDSSQPLADSIQPPAAEPRRPRKLSREKSTKKLAGDLARQTSTLVHRELDLAKADIRSKARDAGAGAGALGVAAVAGLVGLACATAAAIAGLALVWPVWAAALLVSGFYLLMAAVFAGLGIVGMKRASGRVAAEAIESTKEEAAWLTRQARSARKY